MEKPPEPQPPHGYPFLPELRRVGGGSRSHILASTATSRMLIRESRHPDDVNVVAFGESTGFFRRVSEVFEEAGRYGIWVPGIHIVRGRDKEGPQQKERVFMVVDRIEGKSLDRCRYESSPEFAEALRDFLHAIPRYFAAVHAERLPFFWDWKLSNLMYGHRAGSGEKNRIYVTDVGPEGAIYCDASTFVIGLEAAMKTVDTLTHHFLAAKECEDARSAMPALLALFKMARPEEDSAHQVP